MALKTIISANVSIKTAQRLQNVRKRAKSATIERAINYYLDAEEDFKPGDASTKRLLAALLPRDEIPQSARDFFEALIADMN